MALDIDLIFESKQGTLYNGTLTKLSFQLSFEPTINTFIIYFSLIFSLVYLICRKLNFKNVLSVPVNAFHEYPLSKYSKFNQIYYKLFPRAITHAVTFTLVTGDLQRLQARGTPRRC